MHWVIDLVGYVLMAILVVQSGRMYSWVAPIQKDNDAVFCTWPYIIAIFGVVAAFPFHWHVQYHISNLAWGFILLCIAAILHIALSSYLLHQASTYHGRYRQFWF